MNECPLKTCFSTFLYRGIASAPQDRIISFGLIFYISCVMEIAKRNFPPTGVRRSPSSKILILQVPACSLTLRRTALSKSHHKIQMEVVLADAIADGYIDRTVQRK
jgi:hypothetical protein